MVFMGRAGIELVGRNGRDGRCRLQAEPASGGSQDFIGRSPGHTGRTGIRTGGVLGWCT